MNHEPFMNYLIQVTNCGSVNDDGYPGFNITPDEVRLDIFSKSHVPRKRIDPFAIIPPR